jgi:type II secretory pathway component PulJ
LTVLELVSALALFVVILGTLMVALDAATDIWARTASRNRAQQNARRALDLLSTDLASAVAHASDYKPYFIAEFKSDSQVGLYFVRQRSPVEISKQNERSLELIAYSWTTNGLSRYAVPVVSTDAGQILPPVSEQLDTFKKDVSAMVAPSNILSSAIVRFLPLVYQPLSLTNNVSGSKPIEPLNPNLENVELGDLPDFLDVQVACVDRLESATVFSSTNYMTRRIILPAAQASRLP